MLDVLLIFYWNAKRHPQHWWVSCDSNECECLARFWKALWCQSRCSSPHHPTLCFLSDCITVRCLNTDMRVGLPELKHLGTTGEFKENKLWMGNKPVRIIGAEEAMDSTSTFCIHVPHPFCCLGSVYILPNSFGIDIWDTPHHKQWYWHLHCLPIRHRLLRTRNKRDNRIFSTFFFDFFFSDCTFFFPNPFDHLGRG